jgi:tRNA G10  N-methylase Trm11
MACLKPGFVVLDPMAGVFTIPIEASLMQPGLCLLGGDLVENPAHMVANTESISLGTSGSGPPPPFGMQQWDSTRLPLRDASVDAIICDMPFGLKCGSKSRNQKLYPKTLASMCRVLRVGCRAVILSTEHRLMYIAASQARRFKLVEDRQVTLGTLHTAHVLVLEKMAENIEEGSLICPTVGSRRKRRGVLNKPNGSEVHTRQLYRHILMWAGANPQVDL